LGGLFAKEQTPDLDRAQLANSRFLKGLYNLAWLRRGGALLRINWRDMETEEFGSVYESLLELTPTITDGGRSFSFVGEADEDAVDNGATKASKKAKAAKGNERKTTGSYYTPDSLVQLLLKEALDPVIDGNAAENPNDPEALLALKVIDPACGSGHFLLAAARKIARRLAEARHTGSPTIAQYRHALREVVRFCIHGVDRNPMAVELTKVALWIETIEPGRPLGFLDANIRSGDSLLGVFDLEALRRGIPDEAYKPLTGDDKETAKHFAARNRAEKAGQGTLDFGGRSHGLPAPPPLADASRAMRALPEDNVEQIAEKQRRVRAAEADPGRWPWRVAADLYVAAFLTPKTGGVPADRNTVTIPTTEHVWAALAGRTVYGPLIGRAQDVAGEARAFHWPLEFPEAFATGGFDVLLGNPPWERIKLQEQEFFATRDAEIATAPNAAARGQLIAKLREAAPGSRERGLHEEFEAAKRIAEASSAFARVPAQDGGRFALTGRGDVNIYALFAELFASIASKRGRAGVIVPTGIATDATTAPFFAGLVADARLCSLFSFYEVRRWFKDTDERKPFCLLTIGESRIARFAFEIKELDGTIPPDKLFELTQSQITLVNPNTSTAPIFRSRHDAMITSKIFSTVPILFDERRSGGNVWSVSFRAMFHMANDSHLFRTAKQLAVSGARRDGRDWVTESVERYVPLYEGKMIGLNDHRYGTFENISVRPPPGASIPRPEESRRSDPDYDIEPWYWIRKSDVDKIPDLSGKQWFFAFRDVTNTTAERTFVGAILPRSAVNHKAPLLLSTREANLVVGLIANLSSLILDFIARQKVSGSSMTYFYVKQFPVLSPSFYLRKTGIMLEVVNWTTFDQSGS
jgi:hypothetical protein